MPFNIQLDYEQITSVSAKLTTASTELVPMLNGLRSDVDNLLHNGLVFQQSSGAIMESYQKFHDNLIQAAQSIDGFANQFRDIKKNMEDMDTKMASSVREGTK
ncbi:WXG100 family type VII secretion target [Kitasatospora sp. NPDC089509]|uniref:WXG100 family type VII secretion target n=1 Tax=Kitasatospora sp. NPDC089509 TaxID=3364079 RepID=UPI00382770EB